MKKFIKEFGLFISKGNALDLAIGIVIGTAFNAIIKSLVNDIIMPLISLLTKGDVKSLYVVLKGTATYDQTLGQLILSEDAVLLTYGNFIQSIFDFLIVALAVFLALKVIMTFRTKIELLKNQVVNIEQSESNT
ncbi:MAG: large conductance mechanosensitive channel protein MscL [Firmicutes bacterium]|nr:large conductance mechanosensitive channel protein MscL [Bacillota bacterium]